MKTIGGVLMPDRHYHHHHHHWRDRGGYAYRAGDPGPGPNPHRLYKNKEKAVISGVCAGIADFYGWSPVPLRVILVIAMFFSFPLPVIAYVAAALLMKPGRSAPVYQSAEEEKFWRTFSTRPRVTLSELKHRFRALDGRLAEIEKTVVSDEYGLKKAFRDLERNP